MVLRRFWLKFRVTKGRDILWQELNPKWFLFRALISFSAHISRSNGFTAILTKFLPSRKWEVFYEKNQFPNCFLFSSIISFFAYISWNNGFTAILTEFSGPQTRRYFMRRINSQMVFYFGTWLRFLHISREIMVLRWFWRNFRVTTGWGILWEESVPK